MHTVGYAYAESPVTEQLPWHQLLRRTNMNMIPASSVMKTQRCFMRTCWMVRITGVRELMLTTGRHIASLLLLQPVVLVR